MQDIPISYEEKSIVKARLEAVDHCARYTRSIPEFKALWVPPVSLDPNARTRAIAAAFTVKYDKKTDKPTIEFMEYIISTLNVDVSSKCVWNRRPIDEALQQSDTGYIAWLLTKPAVRAQWGDALAADAPKLFGTSRIGLAALFDTKALEAAADADKTGYGGLTLAVPVLPALPDFADADFRAYKAARDDAKANDAEAKKLAAADAAQFVAATSYHSLYSPHVHGWVDAVPDKAVRARFDALMRGVRVKRVAVVLTKSEQESFERGYGRPSKFVLKYEPTADGATATAASTTGAATASTDAAGGVKPFTVSIRYQHETSSNGSVDCSFQVWLNGDVSVVRADAPTAATLAAMKPSYSAVHNAVDPVDGAPDFRIGYDINAFIGNDCTPSHSATGFERVVSFCAEKGIGAEAENVAFAFLASLMSHVPATRGQTRTGVLFPYLLILKRNVLAHRVGAWYRAAAAAWCHDPRFAVAAGAPAIVPPPAAQPGAAADENVWHDDRDEAKATPHELEFYKLVDAAGYQLWQKNDGGGGGRGGRRMKDDYFESGPREPKKQPALPSIVDWLGAGTGVSANANASKAAFRPAGKTAQPATAPDAKELAKWTSTAVNDYEFTYRYAKPPMVEHRTAAVTTLWEATASDAKGVTCLATSINPFHTDKVVALAAVESTNGSKLFRFDLTAAGKLDGAPVVAAEADRAIQRCSLWPEHKMLSYGAWNVRFQTGPLAADAKSQTKDARQFAGVESDFVLTSARPRVVAAAAADVKSDSKVAAGVAIGAAAANVKPPVLYAVGTAFSSVKQFDALTAAVVKDHTKHAHGSSLAVQPSTGLVFVARDEISVIDCGRQTALWRVGRPGFTAHFSGGVKQFGWFPRDNTRFMAVLCQENVQLIDAYSGNIFTRLYPFEPNKPTHVAFIVTDRFTADDSVLIFVLLRDGANGYVLVWDVKSLYPILVLQSPEFANATAFQLVGTTLIVAAGKKLVACQLTGGDAVVTPKPYAASAPLPPIPTEDAFYN